MKWLIVIGIIVINCYSYTISPSIKYNKQNERKLYFNKYRSNYSKQASNIISLYKYTKSQKKSNLLLGNSWKSLGPNDFKSELKLNNGFGRVNCLAINPLDSNELWAGSAGGGLWIYSIKDSIWKINPDTDFMSIGISSIAFAPSNPNIVYLATGDSRGGDLFRGYSIGILKSIDNGKSFSLVSPLDKDEMIFIKKIIVNRSNPDEIFVASNKGLYYWNTVTDSSKLLIDSDYISDIEYNNLNSGIMYVSTANKGTNFVYKSIDSGKSFERIFQIYNSNRVELATLEYYPDYLFVLADCTKPDSSSQLFVSSNLGASFKSLLNQEASKDLIENQGSYNLTLFVNPKNINLIYVGGVPLFRSIDGGHNWEKISSNIHVDQHDMIIDNEGTIYLANDGGVYKSYNFGNTWESISKGLNITQFYCVAGHRYHPELIYAGSQDNGLIRFVPNDNFHILTGDATGINIVGNNYDKVFAVLNKGQLYYSDDYGHNFDGINLTYDIPEERTWKSPLYISQNADTIIIAFKNLWISTNMGKSWSALSDFSNINNDYITAMANISMNKAFIAKNKDLYLLNNKNISKISSFNAIISSILFNGKNLLVTFGNFDKDLKVISIDENFNIKNLTLNLPNIPISKIIYNDIDNSYYIASDLGVFKLDSVNNEWVNLTNNIGTPIVNDIDFNNITGKMYVATFGKGIWEFDFSNCKEQSISLNANDNDIYICENTNYELSHNQILSHSVNWSNGAIGDTINIHNEQIYFAYYIDSNNCLKYSNIVDLHHYKKSSIKLIALSKNPQCMGDSVYITAIADELDSCQFFWSNGAIGDTIAIYGPGDYFTISQNKYGCLDTSSIFKIYYVDKPNKPILTYLDNKIVIDNNFSEYSNYDIIWNINGIDTLFNSQSIVPIVEGVYYAKFQNMNYCQSISNKIIVHKEDLLFKISIYPTIVEDNLSIQYYCSDQSKINIKIYDIIGTELNSYSAIANKGVNIIDYDMSKYSQGIYIFAINNGNLHKIYKIIKIKS